MYTDVRRSIDFDQVNSFYPYLWTKEGQADPDVRVIDANEALRLRIEISGYATR